MMATLQQNYGYICMQAGLPHELDPATLHTIGESHMEGALRSGTLAGHYRIMHGEGGARTWVTFSTQVTFAGTRVTFYEFGEDGSVLHESSHALSVRV